MFIWAVTEHITEGKLQILRGSIDLNDPKSHPPPPACVCQWLITESEIFLHSDTHMLNEVISASPLDFSLTEALVRCKYKRARSIICSLIRNDSQCLPDSTSVCRRSAGECFIWLQAATMALMCLPPSRPHRDSFSQQVIKSGGLFEVFSYFKRKVIARVRGTVQITKCDKANAKEWSLWSKMWSI